MPQKWPPSVAGADGGVAVSGGAESQSTGTVIFSNSNGLSFGLNAGTMTASHNALTSQSNQAFSADASSAFQTLVFQDSNGVSFSNNAGSLRVTHALQFTSATSAITSAAMHSSSRPAFSADASSTFQTLTLQNSNGISFSNNAGAVRITHDLMFSSSRPAFSAGAASSTFQTVVFQDSNGLSFSNNAGSIRGSYTVPVQSNGILDVSTATASGTATSRFAMHDHQHRGIRAIDINGIASTFFGNFQLSGGNNITLSSGGNTTAGSVAFHGLNQAFSAGAASSSFQTLIFQDSNGISFSNNAGSVRLTHGLAGTSTGFAGANISGSITLNTSGLNLSLSVAAPGAAAEANWVNLLGANTAGNTTASGSTIGLSGVGVTLSGTNNSVIVISGGGGGGATLSGYDGYANNEFLAIAGGQASLWIDRLDLPCAMQFDRFGLRITHSNATNSSGSGTISVWVGISTRNVSTLSSVASTSFTTAFTQSGTAGSYSNYGGIRILPVPWTTTLGASNYWLGVVSRTTTGGANMTFGNLANSQLASTMSGFFGSGSNATNGIRLAVGVYSVTTAGMPTAISITQINGNSSAFLRQPAYLFMSSIF